MQSGLKLCCSYAAKSGFLATRPSSGIINVADKPDVVKFHFLFIIQF